MNSLWPVKEFLTFIFSSTLGDYIETKINLDNIENIIRKQQYAEISHLNFKLENFNKLLWSNNLPVECYEGKVDKIYLKFPINYLKEKIEINIENLNICFHLKRDFRTVDKKLISEVIHRSKTTIMQSITKIINSAANNVEISLNNISLSFDPYEGGKKLKILAKQIIYSKFKDNLKDSLFLLNKKIEVFNLILVEDEGDIKIEKESQTIKHDFLDTNTDNLHKESLFKIIEEKNESLLIDYITKKNILINLSKLDESNSSSTNYSSNRSFAIYIEEDTCKKGNLKISLNVDKFEAILTKDQYSLLLSYFTILKQSSSLLYSLEINQRNETNDHKRLEILGFKINHINCEIKIKNLNILILENILSRNLDKPKMWLSYEKYFQKYFLSADSYLFNCDNINNIEKFFSYFEENFFVFNCSEILMNLNLLEPVKDFEFQINIFNFDYVEPTYTKRASEIIVINNIIENEVQKYYDENYSKIFLNCIKHSYLKFTIFEGKTFSLKTKHHSVNEKSSNSNNNSSQVFFSKLVIEYLCNIEHINMEINPFVLLKIININFVFKNQLTQINERIYTSKQDKKLGPDISKKSVIAAPRESKLKDLIDMYSHKTDEKPLIVNQENKIHISFNLNIKISSPFNCNQIFKNFYDNHFDIQKSMVDYYDLSQTFYQPKNFKSDYLSIGDNMYKDNITLIARNSEIFHHHKLNNINKIKEKSTDNKINFSTETKFDSQYIYLLLFANGMYLPLAIYKNQSFVSFQENENKSVIITSYSGDKEVKNFRNKLKYYGNINSLGKDNIHRKKLFYENNSNYSDNSNLDIHDNKYENINIFVKRIDLFLDLYCLKKISDFIILTSMNFKILSYLYEAIQHKLNLFDFEKYLLFHRSIYGHYINLIENKNTLTNYININLDVEELNIIGFSNLNLQIFDFISPNKNLNTNIKSTNTGNCHSIINTSKEMISAFNLENLNLLVNYIEKNENIFFLLDNPYLKVKLEKISTSTLIVNKFIIDNNFDHFKSNLTSKSINKKICLLISIDRLKVLLKKTPNSKDEDFKLKYDNFFNNVYEEEIFDFLIYKGNGETNNKSNILSAIISIDVTEKNSKSFLYDHLKSLDFSDFFIHVNSFHKEASIYKSHIDIVLDDICINPLNGNFNNHLRILDGCKKDYIRYHILIKNQEDLVSINLVKNELNQYNNLNRGNFSNTQEMSRFHHINLFQNIEMKIRLKRIIIDLYSYSDSEQLNQINIYNHGQDDFYDFYKKKMRMITEIEGIYFENKVVESKFVNFSTNKIQTILLKNLDHKFARSSLENKCKDISKENSLWRQIGFVEIFNLDHLEISLKEINNLFNFEMLINWIEMTFCKDSFKYFNKFTQKSLEDFKKFKSVFNNYDFDKESVLTEIEMIQDKIAKEEDYINFNKNQQDDSITYKKVNYTQNNKNKAQSYEINKRDHTIFQAQSLISPKYGSLRDITSIKKDKFNNLHILDNFDKRSFSSDKNRKDKFHSHLNSKDKDDLDHEESISSKQRRPINNQIEGSDKENCNKPLEKLNIVMVINNFKFYVYQGKDFNFLDKYTHSETETGIKEEKNKNRNTNILNEKNDSLCSNFTNELIEIHKNDLEFNVTINKNPSLVEIYDSYFDPDSKEGKGVIYSSDIRTKINSRDYTNFILLSIHSIENKFFYFDNSPLVLSYYLEIRSVIIEDSLKNSKYKKMLSSYNFDDESTMFLTTKIDFVRTERYEVDLNIFINLNSINLFLDLTSFVFLNNFFDLEEKLKIEERVTNETVIDNEHNTNQLSESVSALDDICKSDNRSSLISLFRNGKIKFNVKRFIIPEFFINICYNPSKIQDSSRTNSLSKLSSVQDLCLIFKSFNFKGKKNLEESLKEIFDFWKKDILTEQIIQAYLSSLTLVRPFKNIVGGFIEIFKQPYQFLQDDRSVFEGFTHGVKTCLIIFSTETLIFGEKVILF
jgi:hypothetical protein